MSNDDKIAGNLEELRKLVAEFDTSMLITQTPEGLLRARPMALQDTKEHPDCDLWLVTSDDTAKVAEITYEDNVCVACFRQSDRAYVSISARARVTKDRAEIKRLWKPDWKIWWESADDPSIAILKLEVRKAEYWEPEGGKLKVMYEMLKGMLTGKRGDEGLNPAKEI